MAYAKHAKSGMRYLASYQDVSKTKDRCNEGVTFIALDGSSIIGTITINHQENSCNIPWYEKNGITSFHQFGVHPNYQSKGVGSLLLNAIEDYARGNNISELAFDTSENAIELINYYKKRGYRLVDECKWDHTNYKSLIFSKKL